MVDSEIFASPKTGGCPLSLGQILDMNKFLDSELNNLNSPAKPFESQEPQDGIESLIFTTN
jgi:hypothetical protein